MFSFLSDASKPKVCRSHLLELTDRQFPVFPISAYDFILTENDQQLYIHRQSTRQTGLTNIDTLSSQCEKDWELAQKHIQHAQAMVLNTVDKCFRELRLQVTRQYQETKKILKELKADVERLTVEKTCKLGELAENVCKIGANGPLFGVILGDLVLPVTETVMGKCQVLPCSLGNYTTLAEEVQTTVRQLSAQGKFVLSEESANYVKALGVSESCESHVTRKEKATKRLMQLLPYTAAEHEVRQAAEFYCQAGVTAAKTQQYSKALAKLQKGWALLQLRGLESPEIALRFGHILCHFGRYSEAVTTLWQGLDVKRDTGVVALQLGNELAETYHQLGEWEKVVDICQWTLQTGENEVSERLKALYYLASAHYKLGRGKQGCEAVKAWKGKLTSSSSHSKCLLTLIQAERCIQEENREEAARLYSETLQLGVSSLSPYLTACVYQGLAGLYDSQPKLHTTEDTYLHSVEIYKQCYPYCIEFATCLNNLGCFYGSQKYPDKEEQSYLQAYTLYKTYFPTSLGFANCLNNLGAFYASTQNTPKAEQMYKQAVQVYAEFYTESREYVSCLNNLGLLHLSLRRWKSAEKDYLTACKICTGRFPRSIEFARCLINQGYLYGATNRPYQAEKRYAQAQRICTEGYSTSIEMANCLCNLALIRFQKQEYLKAEAGFAKAVCIYSTYHPQSLELANCYANLGVLYSCLHLSDKEELHYTQACHLYETYFPASMEYANCVCNLAQVRLEKGSAREAIEKYSVACKLYESLAPRSAELAECMCALGQLLLDKGDNEKASYMIEKAVEIFEGNGDTPRGEKRTNWP